MRYTLLAAMLLAGPAAAQEAAPAAAPAADAKVSQLIVYGDDPCPQSSGDEIVVCARKPEGERFRIPQELRDNPNDPVNQSWTNRATELQYVGRTAGRAGRPRIGQLEPAGRAGPPGTARPDRRRSRGRRSGSGGAGRIAAAPPWLPAATDAPVIRNKYKASVLLSFIS
jgi:hypothetical protein